jgi:hypothetical protein
MLEILKPAGRLLNRVFAPSLVRIHLLVSQIGAAIGVERGKIQKLQIPTSKLQRNHKLQTPDPREAPNTKSQIPINSQIPNLKSQSKRHRQLFRVWRL